MKKAYILLSVCILPLWLSAQLNTTFTINTNKERQLISPYIYSTNGQSLDRPENIAGRRLGGDRMTSYNWENNFSNGGSDYINDNDNYMPYSLNLPFADYLIPNIVPSAFHDTSISMNCTSLMTLPMCGYVSRDGNGVVSTSPPSSRWRQVINKKGSTFSLIPDTADNFVYVDECMNSLITQFGNSTTSTGIKDYEMDNEWSIWNSSQPILHPAQPTISEAIKKSVALSATIKGMDPTSLVYGPVDYGYASYLQFQAAPDWSSFTSYSTFCGAYLAYMKSASDSVGQRLLDVYDVHYYSSAQGLDHLGNLEVVDGGNNDIGVAIARMQAPRTLWDSTYVENSWIGEFYSPVAYIQAIQSNINMYNPGTKIAFTEYGFGGENHISGGIALADMLGISGRFGVYWTSVWGPVDSFFTAAFKIYRNYDGNNSTFGNIHVYANTNNWQTSSVYSAIQSTDTNTMNVIAMNKDYDSTLIANFNITANTTFNKVKIYAFNQTDTNIQYIGSKPVIGNSFSYTIPQLSVYHFVFSDSTVTTGINIINNLDNIAIYPNPSTGIYTITFDKTTNENLTIEVMDITGKTIKTLVVKSDIGSTQLNLQDLPNGVYITRISSANGVIMKKLIKE
jgi:mannan endo-1,4-beta-mannosidase